MVAFTPLSEPPAQTGHHRLEIRNHRARYLVILIDQRYSRPPVERAARMTHPEGPHLAQADLVSTRYVKKRMLVVELCDLSTRHFASSTIEFVPSEDNRKLIIEWSVTATEAHNHQSRLWPGQHTG